MQLILPNTMMYRHFVTSNHSQPPASNTDHRLMAETTVEDVALACRRAVTTFLEESRHGWSPSELARWRMGPFERALVVSRLDAPITTIPPLPPLSSDMRSNARFANEVGAARLRTLELVGLCKLHPSGQFAKTMLDLGAIERIHDAFGGVGWAPTARVGLKLVEQLATLVIADCLTLPRDYERLVIHGDDVSFLGRGV